MGTNFYFRDKPCNHCGRYDEVHVGKASAGWSFHFRAWPHRPWMAQHPEWGFDPLSPFGFPVVSRADWRNVFTARSGELFDEHGQQVEDPVAWLDGLPPPDAQQQQWEHDHMGPFWRPDPDWEWRDAEGFSFYAGEFS